MRTRNFAVLAVVAGVSLGLAMSANSSAREPQGGDKGTNSQPAPKDSKDSAKTMRVQDLELASRMVNYGRQHKNAEFLIQAAQLIHKTPIEQSKTGWVVDGSKTDGKSSPAPLWTNAKDLLTEAKKWTSTPQAEALWSAADKMLQESTRGVVGGAVVDGFTINGGETINWKPVNFRGNEKAVVFVDVGQNSRMTMEIFDENNNLVVRDNVPGNFYECIWFPKVTGAFRVRLTNHDNASYICGMATN